MSVLSFDWLRRHADAVFDPSADLPFDAVRSDINLKRANIMCWLGIVNEVCEIAVAARLHTLAYLVSICANIAVFLAVLAVSFWARRHGSARFKAAVTPLAATLVLLMWQSSIAVLAASGRLSTAYPMIVLVIALVFVWPPPVLVAVLAGTLATFALVVLQTPAPAFEQWVAIRTACFSALVATVAGALIHSARQRDYLLTLALHTRNKELQHRNAELDEVMAFAAHDLRSPLLGLNNLLAYARPRLDGNSALAAQTLDEAARSITGMLGLIRSLLDAHEAEHGRLCSRPDDLRTALIDCADRNRASAEAVGISLSLHLPRAAVIAPFDPLALERVLDNLVSNAVRFSPSGSDVTLACDAAGGSPRITVADEGVGLAQGERDRLFEKFRRTRALPPNGSAGTGLGLFIVGVLTKRMGALVSYRPRTPTGSIFEVAWNSAVD